MYVRSLWWSLPARLYIAHMIYARSVFSTVVLMQQMELHELPVIPNNSNSLNWQ